MTEAAPRGYAFELPRSLAGRIALLSLITAVYFAAGKAGLALAFVHVSASPVWAPTGIALATFLLLGYRTWPAIFVGAFLVNSTTAGSAWTSVAIALGNTLEGIIGAWLVRRYACGLHAFDRPSDILRFLVLAAGVAPTISATVGLTSLALFGYARWSDYDAIWTTWWLGDAMGALIVTPPLVLAAIEPWTRPKAARLAEIIALVVGLLATALLVFGGFVPFAFLCIPFPLWAAFRLGPCEAASANCLLAIVAAWGTIEGRGPFVEVSPNESLLVMQAFSGLLSVLGLAAAAVVAQRERVERELRAAREELEERVRQRTSSLSHAVEQLEHEVGERRRAERELRESEQRVRQMNLELEQRVRQRTAELERSNVALREFHYAVGHDLQEPLRTVCSYAELLGDRTRGRLDGESQTFLGFIADGASWMQQLLKGLLSYSRIESRPRTTALVPMEDALDHAVENLGASIAANAARITRSPLPVVPADEMQMVQLWQNLVGNAIKFRRPGARLEVHVEAQERDAEWLFTVRDNGIGIEPQYAERIFGIFQRLHRREEFPGTGVGLAICRKIVERHGGRIWVESDAERGSAFHFTLPAARAGADRPVVGFDADARGAS